MTKDKVSDRSSRRKGDPARTDRRGEALFVGVDLAKPSRKITVRTCDLRLSSLAAPASVEGLADFPERAYAGARIHPGYRPVVPRNLSLHGRFTPSVGTRT